MTAIRKIIAQALTQRGFAPYGEMIGGELIVTDAAEGVSINGGSAQRFDLSTDIDAHGGAACVTLFRTTGHAAPFRLSAFERHCLGSQTFVPQGQGRCLAVVTCGAQTPDEDQIQAFIVEPGQGVTLRRGIWHHPLITPGAANVLVIERRATDVDCEVVPIAGCFIVDFA
jgi:ureidoglycolate lyase